MTGILPCLLILLYERKNVLLQVIVVVLVFCSANALSVTRGPSEKHVDQNEITRHRRIPLELKCNAK